MAWLLLCIAGLFEIAWAISLKYADGFTRFWPSMLMVLSAAGSFLFLSQSIRTISLGTGYAVWTGMGVVGTVVLSRFLFAESISPLRLLCIALIATGVVGLNLLDR